MNHLKNAQQILDSYEANEELEGENLLHSATHALVAIAEQLEKIDTNVETASMLLTHIMNKQQEDK